MKKLIILLALFGLIMGSAGCADKCKEMQKEFNMIMGAEKQANKLKDENKKDELKKHKEDVKKCCKKLKEMDNLKCKIKSKKADGSEEETEKVAKNIAEKCEAISKKIENL